MEIDFSALAPRDRYKLLVGFVIPRPIAFITTVGADGVTNAAPFSFFNVFGEDPALVILGFDRRPDGALKDTVRNILDRGEFVVNMVDDGLAVAMNECAVDFPSDVDELTVAGLTSEKSQVVAPPRIAESPASFECRLIETIQFKPHRTLVLGEVLWMRAKDAVLDPKTLRVIDDAYCPVGRLYADLYARQTERFSLVRQTYDQWLASKKADQNHDRT